MKKIDRGKSASTIKSYVPPTEVAPGHFVEPNTLSKQRATDFGKKNPNAKGAFREKS